jgi:hypothetical protein
MAKDTSIPSHGGNPPGIPAPETWPLNTAETSQGVDSSAIAAVGYDTGPQRLLVTFNSGRTYAYYGVSSQSYYDFTIANSKGRFFNQAVKGRYAYRRLS